MASWCARCVQWLREISLYTTCCCPKLAPPRKSCLEMRLQPASSRILSLSLSLSLEECRRLFQQPTSLYTEHKNTTPRPRDSRIRGGSGKGIFGSRSKFTDHDSTVASSTVSLGQTSTCLRSASAALPVSTRHPSPTKLARQRPRRSKTSSTRSRLPRRAPASQRPPRRRCALNASSVPHTG